MGIPQLYLEEEGLLPKISGDEAEIAKLKLDLNLTDRQQDAVTRYANSKSPR